MSELTPVHMRLCWCQVPVPQELEAECLCVLHFILSIDHDCADLRRETAMGKTSIERQAEIASYVKATAMKLTEVATGRMRLSDEFKKRILTTLLTLMNLQESLDRAGNRCSGIRELRAPVAPVIVAG
jgi:beta-lactamase class A